MPKSIRVWNEIQVVGRIWQPGVGLCAYVYTPSAHDVENMLDEDGKLTRESVAAWLDTHSGDFREIVDFAADFGDEDFVSPWASEENEMAFLDCMYPNED